MTNRPEHIVITGASQGIGEAIALRFAEAFPGARLSLLARNETLLAAVAESCNELGADARIYPCDLTQQETVVRACESLLVDSDVPTLCVSNAGMFEPGGITDTTLDRWRFQIDVNLTSAFLITSHLLPPMLNSGRGHIIFIASVASIRGYPRGVAYCASKHGLLGLARAIREETKEAGIRVTSILPGATFTASWEGTDFPVERLMPAKDIAEAVLGAYQLSERSVVEEIIIRPQLGDI